MDPIVQGAAIQAGGGLVSSMLGGGQKSGHYADRKVAYKAQRQAREFAQKSIQWRVKDAKKAGIHPLAALGAAGATPSSAVSVGGSYQDRNMGDALGDASQNIGRAIAATQTKEQRLHNEFMMGQEREQAAAKTEILKGQATSIHRANNPPMANITPTPREQMMREKGTPSELAGSQPDVDFADTAQGGVAPVIPKDAAESYESDPFGMVQWHIRNRLAPAIGKGVGKPSLSKHKRMLPKIPKGKMRDWEYSFTEGQWFPVVKDKPHFYLDTNKYEKPRANKRFGNWR
jgi:hypothetical protein